MQKVSEGDLHKESHAAEDDSAGNIESAVRAGHVARLAVPGFEVELWKQLLYHRDKWMSQPMQASLHHLSGILLQEA